MRIRPTVRLFLLDPQDRLLLFRVRDPSVRDPNDPTDTDPDRIFWVTPGGGVEPGETFPQAALREIVEETGILNPTLGPLIGTREKLLLINGKPVLGQEEYYVARVPTAEIWIEGMNAAERATVLGPRWWTAEELRATTEMMFPETIPSLMPTILTATEGFTPIVIP